jgi:hypothetical protein
MEDGVEIVLNHIETYKMKGERSSFLLEEVLLVDMESKEIEETGLQSNRILAIL